jgi:hypothetical protein
MTLWPVVAAPLTKECREQLGAVGLIQGIRNGQIQSVSEHLGYM